MLASRVVLAGAVKVRVRGAGREAGRGREGGDLGDGMAGGVGDVDGGGEGVAIGVVGANVDVGDGVAAGLGTGGEALRLGVNRRVNTVAALVDVGDIGGGDRLGVARRGGGEEEEECGCDGQQDRQERGKPGTACAHDATPGRAKWGG